MSFARQPTSSRNAQTAGGVIHASGNRPNNNNMSIRSIASRSSFFTRRVPKFNPDGLARWTVAPCSCN
jgi:hypothetical protein